MLIDYKRGQGSIILRVKILDSAVSTGAGKTGLTSSSAGLIISAIADTEAAGVAYTQAGGNIESITTLGTYAAPTSGKCRFKEVDPTNHKGVYEIQLADARYAVSNAKSLLVSVCGAAGAAETDVVIPLRDLDPYDAVRAGLTALPTAAPGAANGLTINGSNAAITFASLTVTGQLVISDGVAVTVSTTNRDALSLVGNGSGNAITLTAGATGTGVRVAGGATSGRGVYVTTASGNALDLAPGGAGNAIRAYAGAGGAPAVDILGTGGSSGIAIYGNGGAAGVEINGGATGAALWLRGGSASGDGLKVTTTSGHGVNIAATGTNMHGAVITGGNGGTSDGVKLVSGTGGVALRAATIVGDLTGNVSGTIGNLAAGAKADAANAIWVDLLAGGNFGTANSIGKRIVDYLDAAISTRLAAAGYTAPDNSGIAAVKTQTDKLTFDGSNRVAGNVKAIDDDAGAATNLKQGALGTVRGTCAVGSTTTVVKTALTEATDDHYNGRVIVFITGALAGQASSISDYAGATKDLTVVALTEAPANGDTFVIV